MALIEASRQAQPLLLRYLKARAKALNIDQCGWQDLGASLGGGGQWGWEPSVDFILEHFGTVTLAHELGHAYHNHVTRDLNPSRRFIPSTLAETASVFAESIVRDAALEAASEDQKLPMLDARLSAGVSFLMNLPARFDFERELYTLRRKGDLVADELSETMVGIQKRWYGDALDSWYPRFWASKLHFYISHFAFYNYPYTFGYLFANLVYNRLKATGDTAAYVDILRRTGWQQSEDLAMETLGLDLTKAETWWAAIAPLEADLQAYEARL